MRSVARGAAVALAAALALAGCGGSGGDRGRTTVVFSYLWTGQEAKSLEKIISDFNASQHKIHVKGVSSPDAQKQLAAMASGKGAFDISDSFGSNVGSWAAKGVLAPLDSYLSADKVDTGDFVPAAMSQMRYQQHVYALPIAVHDFLLLYNKKLFADAGIAGPPATTEEWAADIAALTKADTAGRLTQLGLGNPDPSTSFTTMAYEFGGDWYDGKGHPSPSNPANVAAARFYVDNVPAAHGADKVRTFTSGFGEYASPQNPFYLGKVATVIDGEWQARFIQQYAPSLQWGVAPLPHPAAHPELAGATQLTSSMLFIPRNAKHPRQAWEFLKYLTSRSAMLDFSYALGNLPARLSLLDSPKYADIPQFSAWLQALKSKQVKGLRSQPWSAQYSTDLTAAFDAIANQRQSPADALAGVADKAKSYAGGS